MFVLFLQSVETVNSGRENESVENTVSQGLGSQ